MPTHTLGLTGYATPPLNLNQRSHWAQSSPHRRALRAEAARLATEHQIGPCGHIVTRLHYQAPDRRRRDEDNLIATAKPLWDGLVDAGVVPDDTSEYMTKLMPCIHPYDGSEPSLWLTVDTEESAR